MKVIKWFILSIIFITCLQPNPSGELDNRWIISATIMVYAIIKLIIYCVKESKPPVTIQKNADIDQMSGAQFERFCGNLLAQIGYTNISYTPPTNDFGVDIICFYNGERVAVQCKRYNSPLGIKPLQEVHAGKGHYNASIAVVMTNNYFTQNARTLAEELDIILCDRNAIAQQLRNIEARRNAEAQAQRKQERQKAAEQKKTQKEYNNPRSGEGLFNIIRDRIHQKD